MIKKIKLKIKQLKCKHSYKSYIKHEGIFALNGETVVVMCEKCKKKKYEYFREFEGNGYK